MGRLPRLRAGIAILAVAALAGPAASSPPEAGRRAEAERAAAAFRETVLFAAGRGMHAGPAVTGPLRAPGYEGSVPAAAWALLRPAGLVEDGGRALGLHEVDAGGRTVNALGCVACHGGRAAGITVIGLGNKTVDVGAVGGMVKASVRVRRRVGADSTPEDVRLLAEAEALGGLLADPRFVNSTAGLVPTAMVRQWFYAQAGKPLPDPFPRGAVKVPSLWGYAEKRKAGLFCDGFADGGRPGWAAAVELAAGQRPEVVRGYAARLEAVEREFETFLPPPWPFGVDAARAARGEAAFEAACASCHGGYARDAEGLPVFAAPRFVPWADVRTDRDRLAGVTAEFQALVDAGPLADLEKASHREPGYFAPRLEGVWARFPYLHDASVPTLRALLEPPAKRPAAWSLEDAGERARFDPGAVGLTLPAAGTPEAADLAARAARGERRVYSTARPGQSSEGHEFGTGLTEAEKADLVEYLKTL